MRVVERNVLYIVNLRSFKEKNTYGVVEWREGRV